MSAAAENQEPQPMPQPVEAPEEVASSSDNQQQLLSNPQQQVQQSSSSSKTSSSSKDSRHAWIYLSTKFKSFSSVKPKVYFRNPYKVMKKRRTAKQEKKRALYRQQLQSLLEEKGWPLPAEAHDQVVALLRKKSFLAAEAFHESVSGHSTSPLSFLIAGGASLSAIKEVYAMSPEAVHRLWPEDTYPPLMGACHSGVAHDIIGFLVQEFPGALYTKDFDGSLPINIYMRRSPQGPSFEIIKQMVDLYPESIIVDDRIGWGLSPIDYALRLDFDIRILKYFIEKWPKEENDYGLFWDSNSDFYPDQISLPRIKVLMTLLGELDYFHSFIDDWDPEGLIYVMDCLRENSTVIDLCLRVPCEILLNDSRVVESLIRLLRENKTIQKLTLLGTRGQQREPSMVDDSYLVQVIDALESNTNLQEVNLSDYVLEKGDRLAQYVLYGAAPSKLAFTDITVKTTWSSATALIKNKPISCRTERFSISYCNIYAAWYQGFLNQFQKLPVLKELVLHNGTSLNLNVTTLLVDMLEHSPSILSFKVTGYQVHMRRMAEALKRNTTLIKYSAESSVNVEWKRSLLADTMENHNTTLEWVDLPDTKSRNGPQGQRIAYYSLLNQYGRRKIRLCETVKEFVPFLERVVTNENSVLQEIAQYNILYGLLQENPGLWCQFLNDQEQLKDNSTSAISAGSLLGGFTNVIEV